MPVTVITEPVNAARATYRSSIPFSVAETRLRSTIQREQEPVPVTELATSKAPVFPTREEFAQFIESRIGPHGFMYFHEINHGTWLQAYYPEILSGMDGVGHDDGTVKNARRSIRFLLGNPLIAQTMLRHDLDAGLSVPVELLLAEEVDGTAKIVHFLPSGLIAGSQGASEALVQAAKVLEGKVEALINWVLRDVESGEFK